MAGESVFKAARIVALVLFVLAFCLGCGSTSVDERQTGLSAGKQWDPCGFDKPQCGTGLECFGVCSFECGQKYHQIADGSYEYGLDQNSVDRCAALGGTCERHAPEVDINVCKLPAGVTASP